MDKVRFSIGLKLVLIITALVLISLGLVTFIVSYFVGQDTQITAEENNHTLNMRSAASAEYELSSIQSNTFLLLDMLDSIGNTSALSRQASSFFFERNQNIMSIILYNGVTQKDDRFLVSDRFLLSNDIDQDLIRTFEQQNQDYMERAVKGEVFVLSAAPIFELPILAMLYPWRESGLEQAAIILFSAESLTEIFSTGSVNNSFIVNHNEDLLVHNDFELVKVGANFGNLPIVQEMRANDDTNRQTIYTDENGVEYYAAYSKLSIGDCGVITTVPKASVLKPVYDTLRRNIYLMTAVLFIAVLFIWFFSKTISSPVKDLADASDQIEQGHFEVDLVPRSHDEIGLLTERFVSMGKGLAERERLKDTFGRFINKEIAEKAARGELTLGGETKEVTIFFSDIRSFTAISEKLEPYEVVEFLNDYMTRMVDCVNVTHGVVDKFIGDAVMAVWGAPISDGSPAQDALNCVRAALMMRSALLEFNKGRGGVKKPIIKIGCGINTGPVIAGQIGSNQRMEYTVIGDAVNFASRTESLNKPLGTDILITENTYNLIKDHVLVEQMPSVTVKGKEKPVSMYAVVNMPRVTDIPGAGPDGPKTMAEVRELLGIPVPDYAKVNLDEEEKKYKIQGQ